jgi:uroporphyrinogen-III synthase
MDGADVVALPLTEAVAPDPDDWAELLRFVGRGGYDVVVVASRNAADALVRARAEVGATLPPVVAVGATTAAALAGHGIDAATPARGDALGVAEHLLAGTPRPRRVLWPRAEGGRDEGTARLRAAGVEVDAPVAYRTVARAVDDPEVAHGLDALPGAAVVCFYAPSQVVALERALAACGASLHVLAPVRVVAIGATTAEALRGRGVRVDRVADTPDPDAMARAIVAVYPGRV